MVHRTSHGKVNEMAERESKAKITYLTADGTKVGLVDAANIAAIVYNFSNDDSRTISLADIPEDIARVAMVRGLAEKVRDTYAGSKSVEEAVEAADDMIMRLVAGEWLGAREGGGAQINVFIESVKAVKSAHAKANGLAYDADADEPALREKYVGKEKAKARNGALEANATLRAEYERRMLAREEAALQRRRDRLAAAEAKGGGDAGAL